MFGVYRHQVQLAIRDRPAVWNRLAITDWPAVGDRTTITGVWPNIGFGLPPGLAHIHTYMDKIQYIIHHSVRLTKARFDCTYIK